MVIMKEMDIAYQVALDYLYRHVDYSLAHVSALSQAKFDLGRMAALMDLLGNPHRQYPVIHVAGTKGKGSTAALIASCLQTAGYRVGLFTSPHLQEYTERIQVNGKPISPEAFVELVDFIKPYVAQVEQITTFEITTALGLLYFAREIVNAAVVEVGLGGRLDATNIVDPLVAVITSLSMDHMAVLGDTLPKIAAEKAGIIKPGRPVVLAPQREEARQVIVETATERASQLVEVGQAFHFAPESHSLDGQTFSVWKENETPARLTIPLLGLHQVENAATAYTALQVAGTLGLSVSDADIRRGFENVSWPGRFEVLRREPPLVVDSAHNRDSALRLRQTLDDYFPGRPLVLIFGASEDKDVNGILTELAPRMTHLVATQSVHPRAMPADEIVRVAQKHCISAETVLPVEKAVIVALAAARLKGSKQVSGMVLATGSLFVAAAVRNIWIENKAEIEVKIGEK
jgi:dihydrofolate synthase / folylpolyglutamate synthase